MSYLDTRQGLFKRLIDSAIFGELLFENSIKEPTQDLYAVCYFIPATSESLGKDENSSDDRRGIFQVSIYCKKGVFDNDLLTKCDEVSALFKWGTKISYNGLDIFIQDSTLNEGAETEGYFRRDLSINYMTLAER
jgi:hypothetical protein